MLIIGGGLTGCAIASRVKQGSPTLEVVVIEAGIDATGDPRVTSPMGGFGLAFSELDWAYMTVPQKHTNNRSHYNPAGKTLGGGSVLNYGGWSRGDATDYDEWARLVQDRRWSYDGLLPYFKKSEHYLNPGHSSHQCTQHGFDGPMRCTSISSSDVGRNYGLRQPTRDAWSELGVPFNPDANSGRLLGLSEVDENWHEGVRQPSHLAYDLKKIRVITNAPVQRILFSSAGNKDGKKKACGALLADGRQISARRQVILSAGAHRTPQILMLSGIGPVDELSKHGIPVVVPSPEVGGNMFDHFAIFQWWKLRPSKQGMAIGAPQWTSPAFFKGMPTDWAVKEHVPAAILDKALELDSMDKSAAKALSNPVRPHLETMVIYASGPAQAVGLDLPMDGTYVSTSVMLTLPTSRGRVTLASADVKDPPIVNPNYYATAVDRAVLIYGTRRVMQTMLDTKAGKQHVESEVVPPGTAALSSKSTDQEIDARIRAVGIPHAHASGSAAMGKVIDTKLRVFGVDGLRIADSSVLPVAVSGHPQATLYALAEAAADLILQDLK